MNDARHAVYSAYIRATADQLGLKDWDFKLQRDTPSDGSAAATIWFTYGRKLAEIRLHGNFQDYTPEEQRHYLIHELVHCFTDDVDTVIHQAIDSMDGTTPSAMSLMRTVVKDRLEFATDQIAKALAPHFQIPEQIA